MELGPASDKVEATGGSDGNPDGLSAQLPSAAAIGSH